MCQPSHKAPEQAEKESHRAPLNSGLKDAKNMTQPYLWLEKTNHQLDKESISQRSNQWAKGIAIRAGKIHSSYVRSCLEGNHCPRHTKLDVQDKWFSIWRISKQSDEAKIFHFGQVQHYSLS